MRMMKAEAFDLIYNDEDEDWITLGNEDEGTNARFVSFEDLTHEVGSGESGSITLIASERNI